MTFEEVYQQIRKMHYEILDERESISKSARLSLSTWMLDILTEYRMAIEALKADRPRGEWIDNRDVSDKSQLFPFECSECHDNNERTTNFCPNCGAKMDGERSE